MFKVKHERECDCVVAGFRWHKGGQGTAVGSLLLGLRRRGGAPARRRVGELHRAEAARARRAPRCVPRGRARGSSVGGVGGHGHDPAEGGAGGQRMPGGKSRWSQGKDLSWEPLRPELVARSRTTTCRGLALPAHGAVPALAHRQGPARVHLRAARGRASPRARSDLRAVGAVSRRSALVRELSRLAPPPCARATRASGRRPDRESRPPGASPPARAQVHADARPRRRPPAHRVDEHVVHREVGRRVRMRCFQRSRPASAASLSGELATTTSGIFARGGGLSAFGRASPATARRAGPRPPSSEVRRPRGVRQAGRLVARGELEELLERAGRVVHALVRIAHRAKRSGIVSTVKSAGVAPGTSSHRERRDTRASGSGRTEYAEHVVRSLAFWL
jgi:hypothetical protein